jgi:PAS domain S-box-containing protein
MTKEPLDILIVEDEPAHAEAIRRALLDAETPVEIRVAQSLGEFRKAIATRPPTLVLLDLMLPDGRATDALIAPPEAGPFPMVLMTSHGDEQVAVSAIRNGALDYVVKSPDAFANMPRTVERTMREWKALQESRQAQKALAMREEIFSNIISQAADAIVLFDATTHQLVEFNAAAHERLGYSREEFARLGIADIHIDHSPEMILQNLDEIRKKGELNFETRQRHRDGSTRDVQMRIRPLSIQDHDYMTCVSTDITERKQAEARAAREAMRTEFLLELHQRAPQLSDKALFDHVLERAVQLTESAIGFFHRISEDQSTVLLTTWNQEALRNCTAAYDTYYPLNEAGNWVDCVRQQEPVVYNDYDHSPNQRGLPPGHTPVQRFMSIPVLRDGKVRIIFGVGNKAADYSDDDVKQLQVVANELHKIMVLREDQVQLSRSEERFRQLFEMMTQGVVYQDADGQILFANPAADQILGLAYDQLLGKTSLDPGWKSIREDGSDLPGEAHPAMISLRTGKPAERFIMGIANARTGRRTWILTSAVPIFKPGEAKPSQVISIFDDITDQKESEARLRQAQKLEAIGTLAGGIAHDFNNILAPILGYAEMALEKLPEEDLARFDINEVITAAGRARELVKQILAISRRDDDQLMTLLDLSLITKEALKLLRSSLPSSIEIKQNIQRVVTLANATQVHQVILNLVTNAAHAMEGRGTLEVTLNEVELQEGSGDRMPTADLRPGFYARLRVRDSGAGMSADTLTRIFEPYFTTKEAGKGTGLGLAVVHGIVRKHGGEIGVESVLGKGTTFTVYIPAVKETIIKETEAATALPTGVERILYVDDEAAIARLGGRILGQLGYQVIEMTSPEEALEAFRAQPDGFDLIVTDFTMPRLTGLDLAGEILAVRPDMPIIICTGFNQQFTDEKAREMGIVDFAMKPLNRKQLAELVRKALDREKG